MLRSWVWLGLRKVLFLLDAEKAHRATLLGLRILGSFALGRAWLRGISGTSWIQARGAEPGPRAPQVLGLVFRSRLGLAAGLDKDCEILGALPDLGFGFAEIGTLTPRPQPGNDRPRLFRDPAHDALFNRMGFNNEGAEAAARRLERTLGRLPAGFRVGVNLGKNKDTPAESAHLDYALAAAPFEGLADYLVINVSSPNTPGLRALQTVQALQPIVEAVRERIAPWKSRPPVFLKLAPELDAAALSEIVPAGESWGVEGWVLTNTKAGQWRLPTAPDAPLPGGWSGAPVREASRESLRVVRSLTRRPIISVGGILSKEEALERIRMGADLLQIYSGWILKGPSFPAHLSGFLDKNG